MPLNVDQFSLPRIGMIRPLLSGIRNLCDARIGIRLADTPTGSRQLIEQRLGLF
jgi:hypothetical protein